MAKQILNADGTKQDQVVLPPSEDGKWVVEKGRITDCPFCAAKYYGKRERRQDKRSKIKALLQYAKDNNIQI